MLKTFALAALQAHMAMACEWYEEKNAETGQC